MFMSIFSQFDQFCTSVMSIESIFLPFHFIVWQKKQLSFGFIFQIACEIKYFPYVKCNFYVLFLDLPIHKLSNYLGKFFTFFLHSFSYKFFVSYVLNILFSLLFKKILFNIIQSKAVVCSFIIPLSYSLLNGSSLSYNYEHILFFSIFKLNILHLESEIHYTVKGVFLDF